MNKENYYTFVIQALGSLLGKILIVYLYSGIFSWGSDNIRTSPEDMDDIFISSADSSKKEMSYNDEQIFRLVNDPLWGNLRQDQHDLLESKLLKIYHNPGFLTWVEFPLSPNLPSNPYGIKTWRTCQQQLMYVHYFPFMHFWHENTNLLPSWMYNLTDYIHAPEPETVQLLPCLLKKLSETILLFQNSPRQLGMDWWDIASFNSQEYGSTLSMMQYKNTPWITLCSYSSGPTEDKHKSWLVLRSEHIRALVRKYQYLYRLLYDTAEFAYLGIYEQLWLTHKFRGPIYLINHIMRNLCNNKAVQSKGPIPADYLSILQICCKRERPCAEWLIKYIDPKDF